AFARVAGGEEELIAAPDVDAVAICTRHGSHADLAARALAAGKHVFCEKPIALNVAELERVQHAVARSGRVLGVGFNRRFSPLLEEARGFLAQDGAPVTAMFRVSAGELPPDHWVHDLEEGGGRIVGEVCHFVDCIRFLCAHPIAEVHAAAKRQVGAPRQAHDTVTVTLTLANGAIGSILYVSEGARGLPKERLEAFAAHRTVVLDDFRTLELLDGRSRRQRKLRAQDKGHRGELSAFVSGVRDGRHPVSLDEVWNVHLATFGIVESIRTGRPVRIHATSGT
nr:Gfo/Idh/MocA family oxidoreductase [Actinomycetota bacterium]